MRLKSVIGISGHEGKPHPKGSVGLSEGVVVRKQSGRLTAWSRGLGWKREKRKEAKGKERSSPTAGMRCGVKRGFIFTVYKWERLELVQIQREDLRRGGHWKGRMESKSMKSGRQGTESSSEDSLGLVTPLPFSRGRQMRLGWSSGVGG